MARSLQKVLSPGRGTLPFGCPVLRSNDLSAVGFCPDGTVTPISERSDEHAHSVFDRSSAKTPITDMRPFVPGLTHGSAVVPPGGTRKIVPSARLPMMMVPSDVDVMLSGKM